MKNLTPVDFPIIPGIGKGVEENIIKMISSGKINCVYLDQHWETKSDLIPRKLINYVTKEMTVAHEKRGILRYERMN